MSFTHHIENGQGNRYLNEGGKYNVVILEDYQAQKSQNGAADTMTLNYQVLDGEHEGELIPFDSFYNTEKAAWKIDALLNAVDSDGKSDNYNFQGDGLNPVAEAVINKQINVQVGWRQVTRGKNAGKYFANISQYNPKQASSQPNGEMRPKADTDDTASINQGVDQALENQTTGDPVMDNLPF
ncbi:DUF669 domain-containing protein [Oenococcus oeni]|mgnify:CR=1 FL=1|uniref:DUF669 domain-containing protein n=1 Tax=Oenococcus oeni TaxID=1247 RepID=UPI0010B480DA|nr:DUF669 domain-containing protein [Oenococcus oeni]SYW19509.1 conserved hypothetical protein [Oenococcus oeni]